MILYTLFLTKGKGMFETALNLVLGYEGGYVNDPSDPGGETNMGICKRDYPELNIKNITRDQATVIYKSKYWDVCKCDLLPSALAICVFDSAVNQGTGTSVRLLQEALGVTIDGNVGPVTLAATEQKDIKRLVRDFTGCRILRYTKTKNWDIYGKGWIKRAIDVSINCFQ
jgi:lysozyme family protein